MGPLTENPLHMLCAASETYRGSALSSHRMDIILDSAGLCVTDIPYIQQAYLTLFKTYLIATLTQSNESVSVKLFSLCV